MNAIPPSLTLVREVKAPPPLVYAAWTRPEMLVHWWGPHHTSCVEAEADLRVGGRFRTVIEEPGVGRHEVSGRYSEIVPEKKLVFSWAWASTPDRISRVSVSFRATEAGTEITLKHDQFADAEAAVRHTRGWTESLERLVAIYA
ncbi:MAG: SRPBCC domain-containing protein [Ferrovibrio sp.]|nr:SRPBCC domain-containing protein [Ferrovibrio sp.]